MGSQEGSSSNQAARRALDRYLDAPAIDRETMNHQIKRYLEALKDEGKAAQTIDAYRLRLQAFATWMELHQKDWSRRTVTEYLLHLQTDEGRRPRTIRAQYSAVRGLARWLESTGEEVPVLDLIRLPRNDAPQRVSPTSEQVAAIFQGIRTMPAHTPAARFRKKLAAALFSVFAFCGLRIREVLSLKLPDYRRDGSGPALYVRKGKRNQSGWVGVNSECAAQLTAWLEIRNRMVEEHQQKTGHTKPVEALWLNSRYQPLGERGLCNLWAELLERAGLTGSGIVRHSLRHWSVSGVAAQKGLAAAKEFARHSSIQTTLGYLHSDPRELREATEGLAAMLRPAAGPIPQMVEQRRERQERPRFRRRAR